jgi:hypothetical protein
MPQVLFPDRDVMAEVRLHTERLLLSLPHGSAYASEADLLNVALFGKTVAQWRDENPDSIASLRRTAGVVQHHINHNNHTNHSSDNFANTSVANTVPDHVQTRSATSPHRIQRRNTDRNPRPPVLRGDAARDVCTLDNDVFFANADISSATTDMSSRWDDMSVAS